MIPTATPSASRTVRYLAEDGIEVTVSVRSLDAAATEAFLGRLAERNGLVPDRRKASPFMGGAFDAICLCAVLVPFTVFAAALAHLAGFLDADGLEAFMGGLARAAVFGLVPLVVAWGMVALAVERRRSAAVATVA